MFSDGGTTTLDDTVYGLGDTATLTVTDGETMGKGQFGLDFLVTFFTKPFVLNDLKEKLALPDLEIVGARPDALAKARSALENLGYSSSEVRVALNEAAPPDEAATAAAAMLPSALRWFSRMMEPRLQTAVSSFEVLSVV